MPLSVRHVTRLEEVVEPLVEFLSQPCELFARQRIIVPTAGAKAWLQDTLARRLGGHAGEGGVLANVDFAFPAAIADLLRPHARAGDEWGVERLTFHVLAVLAGGRDFGIPFDVAAEPLLAARRIAARLDRYHYRRPAMILRWEEGAPVMSPFAEGRTYDGDHAAAAIPPADRWQFEVWRAVREAIGSPSPPARIRQATASASGLFVAGLQSLSLGETTSLMRIAATADVRVCLVHPAPPLARRWASSPPAVTPGLPPWQEAVELAADLDPLVSSWLHGTRETQQLLAAQGIVAEPAAPPTPAASSSAPLLARMQATVRSGQRPQPVSHDIATDRSFTVHRCHGLARQAEVLHEALLHAFRELPDLQPHEVAIVSPCIAEAASHLRAVFERGTVGRDAADREARTRLPLVVADRSVRETREAVDLLARLLAAVGSRCGVDDVLEIAATPLVRDHLGIAADDLEFWDGLVERSGIRWGLDADHRRRRGFPADVTDALTWIHGLRRMLLGAVLPDGPERPELAGVVPLRDVDMADVDRIAALVRVVEVLRGLEAAGVAPRPAAAWCRLLEDALAALCGTDQPEVADAAAELRRLREAANDVPVPFADVRTLLADQCEELSGRQPLRTGGITASSMVPLRGVPFRVIGVIGYDDAAIGGFEAEGDDLVARQQLAGDGDPRIDLRRALLDALLAARDRLIVTCTGTSIRTNEPLPLATPLAELVDFAVRHGVARTDPAAESGVEFAHPRHAIGGRNFLPAGIVPGIVWSHDASARDAAASLGLPRPAAGGTEAVPAPADVVEFGVLETLVRDPLKLFLETTLGIDTWSDDAEPTPATFPLAVHAGDVRRLAADLLATLAARPDPAEAEAEWIAAVEATGRLPFGAYGRQALDEIRVLARGLAARAAESDVPLVGGATCDIQVSLADRRLVGHLPGFHADSRRLVRVTAGEAERDSYGRPLMLAALHLLAATAAGLPADRTTLLARTKGWRPGGTGQPALVRTVRLAPALATPTAAAARLDAICGLADEALAAPRPLFGLASSERDFEQFVGRDGYARSTERIVHGPTPAFAAVLPAGSAEATFIARFTALLDPGYDRSLRVYVLA